MVTTARPLEDQVLELLRDIEVDMTDLARDVSDRFAATVPIVTAGLDKMRHLTFDYLMEMRELQGETMLEVLHTLRSTAPVPEKPARRATRTAAPKVVKAA
jgi:hypothetical protein